MTPADELVIRLACQKGLLVEEQLAAARAEMAAGPASESGAASLREVLIKQGGWDPLRSTALLAAEFGMETVELDERSAGPEALALLSRGDAVRHHFFAFERKKGAVSVAVCDPLATDGVDSLALRSGLKVDSYLSSAEAIARAIERHYGAEASSLETLLGDLARSDTDTNSDESHGGGSSDKADAPIIKLVRSIIVEGIQRRASDIHFEPMEKRFRVRYRIDGVLIEAENPPKRFQRAIISRLKIMANISIAEKRLPGDGRMQIDAGGRSLDLRVSSLPTVHGESIVMRVLDKEGLKLGLPELGFLADDQARFEKLINLPDGILLVTGPTGSGKTTTLYGCLHHINHPGRKIITVEDPVEYQLSGINQVPVRHEVGMTFASALRAMLRQAPNVVMVGEIRDRETAEIAINASLTGHMVFSTLHTNDATGAVARLIDLGVKPFLVAAALRAVIAQRLVRKICQKCRRQIAPLDRAAVAGHVGTTIDQRPTRVEAAGCSACDRTGFRGRLGIFEMFVVDDALSGMIGENARSTDLRLKARENGMRTMREDGLLKAKAGLTTVDEVVSITIGEVS
jgi:general secretion pathway protein E/type IV pilus assembly protein PilB